MQADFGAKQEALGRVEENARTLMEYWEKTGTGCRMVNPRGYEKLLGVSKRQPGEPEETDSRTYACWELFFAVLLFYPALVCERQRGTRMLIRAGERGREDYFLRIAAWLLTGSAIILPVSKS